MVSSSYVFICHVCVGIILGCVGEKCVYCLFMLVRVANYKVRVVVITLSHVGVDRCGIFTEVSLHCDEDLLDEFYHNFWKYWNW